MPFHFLEKVFLFHTSLECPLEGKQNKYGPPTNNTVHALSCRLRRSQKVPARKNIQGDISGERRHQRKEETPPLRP